MDESYEENRRQKLIKQLQGKDLKSGQSYLAPKLEMSLVLS